MKKFVLISIAILMWAPSEGFSNQSFYSGHARGWHWYETKKKEPEALKEEKRMQVKALSPTEKVEAIRKDAEGKLHKAMLKPTEQNVKSYIIAQEKIADRSEVFSQVWQRVINKNPELDQTIKNPVTPTALQISRRENLEQKREKIKSLSNEYGLMFFFKGDCSYCKAFAPVVVNFANKYNWDVLPIQIGNVGLPEFPNAKQDNGIVERLGIASYPALIAVHPKSEKMIPLTFGFANESEIEDKVNVMVGSLNG